VLPALGASVMSYNARYFAMRAGLILFAIIAYHVARKLGL
jgi:hypothetical protein